MVLGPSGLSRIKLVKETIFGDSTQIYNQTLATFIRVTYMFLFGLEMDVSYLLRNFKFASWVAHSSAITCSVLAASFSPLLYHQSQSNGNVLRFFMFIMLLLANTSSPTVIKLAAELKIDTSEVGRLAILSAIINEISTLLLITILTTWGGGALNFGGVIKGILLCGFLLVGGIYLNRLLVRYLNQRNPHRKHLRNIEVVSILLLIALISMYTELRGYNSTIASFIFGLMFPREGKTYRTLVHKMGYPVENFILPIFFANLGFQANLIDTDLQSYLIIILIVFLSISGKFGGAFVTCRYLNITPKDSIFLALLSNVKGYADLLIVSAASVKHRWSLKVYNMYVVTVAINTIIVGPFMAFIVRREGKFMAFKHVGLEFQKPESEVRTLACVHGPRHVPTMVGIIAASAGTRTLPFTAYVMHLVELNEKSSTDLLYHQQENGDISDDEDYGGNDELEINESIDAFVADTRLPIHQVKTVSPITTMHDDLCDSAKDLRVSIIILPFHKHQRVDGKMQTSKEGIRTTNQKVLRAAPCSVAILVDRGFAPIQVSDSERKQQVATLFFGGPDDREALAYSSHMAMHPDVKLTVFRFLPSTRKELQARINMESNEEEDEVLMKIMTSVTEKDADEAFLANFYSRYVTSRQVSYVEKYVENGSETMKVLSAMKDMYSLFIVGKGGRGLSPLTTGMSDWEECPELGVVGDVLASSDMVMSASVLVIQQHRAPKNEFIDHHAP
ncbi:Cation/H+ exchanger [Macleaya cordata]|uniref:Cation/H+ exchanger n=1 Tax=Macleaya cordata TaxID=56857 RepID=A0A200R000_MACCD|nr:Cation/H+ exchanger [Macleaya cordata]